MTDQKRDDVNSREEARWADRADRFFTQVNEAAIKTGESTFQACLLINGGAAVSVLAFIGGLASKDLIGVSQLAAIADSLVSFAWGVVAAVAGMALSYSVNYLIAVHTDSLIQRREHSVSLGWLKAGLHGLTVLVGVASVVFFLCGVLAVRNSVEHIQPATHTQAPSAPPGR
jgi:hypothetical protein